MAQPLDYDLITTQSIEDILLRNKNIPNKQNDSERN